MLIVIVIAKRGCMNFKSSCKKRVVQNKSNLLLTPEHYNYLQLIQIDTIDTNWKLFTKDN
jgi:hypothetical protein